MDFTALCAARSIFTAEEVCSSADGVASIVAAELSGSTGTRSYAELRVGRAPNHGPSIGHGAQQSVSYSDRAIYTDIL
jgi:hypothetical protein